MVVERDYPNTYARFTSLGPLMDKLGNGGKGISWNTQEEVDFLKKLNRTRTEGAAEGRPQLKPRLMRQKSCCHWHRKPTAMWR